MARHGMVITMVDEELVRLIARELRAQRKARRKKRR